MPSNSNKTKLSAKQHRPRSTQSNKTIDAETLPASEAFLGRELGTLAFNNTVLDMAANPAIPLLERLRYLSIVSHNLDEFVEIRLAELRERIDADDATLSIDGKLPEAIYHEAFPAAMLLMNRLYELYREEITPQLANEGIAVIPASEWNEKTHAWLEEHFDRHVFPLLTPIGLDPAHPFPKLANKSLNFLIELSGKDGYGRGGTVAILPAPNSISPLVEIPTAISGRSKAFAFVSCMLGAFAGKLFPKMKLAGVHPFRVTRNSDLFVDEEEVKNLLATIQGEIVQRKFGAAVRLEVETHCPANARKFLLGQFDLTETELAICEGPVNLGRLARIPELADRPDLLFPPFKTGYPKSLRKRGASMFDAISRKDILLHHPYQSYSPVTHLLAEACDDPHVAAIKMTVYRTGEDSALMASLARAAQQGKEVTVVLELMARFDEAANIHWASKLEEAGAHVVFGAVGFKTHAKMLMIVRRETSEDGPILRRYVHLGTGNYNPKTARLYTDFSLFTRDEAFGRDVNEIFQQLTGLGQPQKLELIAQAPFGLHSMVLGAIEGQIKLAQEGKPAMVRAKMNALHEPEVIRALYRASQAGVEVRLLVRGMCCLRPGIEGLSERIEVRSIVGRFLEHHRIFAFGPGDEAEVWLSSADWMDRNFFRRIEAAFPILDKKMRLRALDEGFEAYWNSKANVYRISQHGGRSLLSESCSFSEGAQQGLMHALGRKSY